MRWLSRRPRRRIEAPRYCVAPRGPALSIPFFLQQCIVNNQSFDTPREARLLRNRLGCLGTGPSIRLAAQAYSGTGCAVAE
ncbi:MAG: hypothetical protein NZM15_09560 [Flavobacteriales bacterium]|nr:hypothetical protein [Flavobacteriales bacterium]MDW8432935.1 hypothetical protein [Flavobacteriales bacterium]